MLLNIFLNKTYNFSGFLHWFAQRFSVLLILLLTFFLFIFFDIYCFFIMYFFLTLHMFAGVETLISDYLHDDFKSILITFCLKINLLMLLKTFFIFII